MLAVGSEPIEAHLSILLFFFIRQGEPVDHGKAYEPHVCRAQILQEGFPKDEEVTCVLHGLTGIERHEEHGGFTPKDAGD